mmetsp:Transcript_73218/g.210289  ORF Transcript_73218/g.210289 Transcript_73218/m.210289 type:complete len:181 (-) Transcript_73218:246-788(-)|eukprot:CAMPEP_0177198470 /NCGR_PEP_ID=MMETSP0367-20130122/25149_1 /TAXON_ID=447022 ORGANISM="Scrippsiella hangoei-like, Strain SHHI-4" /NCGR_SAMPLE_ID=MMETSP0367 /ASSEMBLY_ACC=CAM_ASM_000362 /LENGTH=180 /DNA_ID=CAMNT_0018646737 /DNA_START=228 /DNA_END=770 /DNA_ORIENTATION=-
MDDGDDDKDGSLCPPLRASACGGGVLLQLGPGWVPMKVWSSHEDSQSGAGFLCAQDVGRKVLYAKLETGKGHDDAEATKGAITTLLDVAEASGSRKITLGLGTEHAGFADLMCSLLYLGFKVAPSRKCPLANTALLLDFDLGLPDGYPNLQSDYTCTATSECSTSAEEADSLDFTDPDTE